MTSDQARRAMVLLRMADQVRAAMDDPRIDAATRKRLELRYRRLMAVVDRSFAPAGRMAA